MSALRWLWRTDGAIMGLATVVWVIDALWDKDWWGALVWAFFALWFAQYLLRSRAGTYDIWLPGGERLATVTTDRDGKPTMVHLHEKPVR